MKRTYNPKNVRRKSNEKRTYNKPLKPEKVKELKSEKGKAEKPEKLENKFKKEK